MKTESIEDVCIHRISTRGNQKNSRSIHIAHIVHNIVHECTFYNFLVEFLHYLKAVDSFCSNDAYVDLLVVVTEQSNDKLDMPACVVTILPSMFCVPQICTNTLNEQVCLRPSIFDMCFLEKTPLPPNK